MIKFFRKTITKVQQDELFVVTAEHINIKSKIIK